MPSNFQLPHWAVSVSTKLLSNCAEHVENDRNAVDFIGNGRILRVQGFKIYFDCIIAAFTCDTNTIDMAESLEQLHCFVTSFSCFFNGDGHITIIPDTLRRNIGWM